MIKTTAYSPLPNNTGDIGNNPKANKFIFIDKNGWTFDLKERKNSISFVRSKIPFELNGNAKINPDDVFIIEDFMTHKYHIHLSGMNKYKFLYFNRELWFQRKDNINLIFTLISAISAVIGVLKN